MGEKYTIGLDYGTLSGRGVLARCSDGEILTSAVKEYPHGVMNQTLPDGTTKLPPAWCLEYPADYVEVLDTVIPKLLKDSGVAKEDIIGIGIDFTSCTMLPVDMDAVPLCEKPEFAGRRNAYVKLWKHHGSQKQADQINELLERDGLTEDPRFGGKVSPELLVPKVMEILEEDPEVYEAGDEILEAGDWLTRLLTGSHNRSCSMAGYKAWWNERDGYPKHEFYKKLNSALGTFAEDKMPGEVCPVGKAIGTLTEEWANRLGLQKGIALKNPMLMQIYADVLGKTLKIAASDQAAALGSAVYAAIAAGEKAGGYDAYPDAVQHMSRVRIECYAPQKENSAIYKKIYSIYCQFSDMMGGDGKHLFDELNAVKVEMNK